MFIGVSIAVSVVSTAIGNITHTVGFRVLNNLGLMVFTPLRVLNNSTTDINVSAMIRNNAGNDIGVK